MSIMQTQLSNILSTLEPIEKFRGYRVQGGVVHVTEDDFIDHLDMVYPDVTLCNLVVKPGEVLKLSKPEVFEQMWLDYQVENLNDLLSQIASGNDVDICFK